MIEQIKKKYSKIPKSLVTFILKAVLFFIGWQLLYQYYLLPTRLIDRHLTNITGIITEKLYGLFYKGMTIQLNMYKVIISIDNQKIIGIADPCNALEIYVLYTAFLLCYPENIKKRLKYIAFGIPVIFCFNIIRVCAITWLNIHTTQDIVDFSHHYLFTSIMYLLVFVIWLRFTKTKNVKNGAVEQ